MAWHHSLGSLLRLSQGGVSTLQNCGRVSEAEFSSRGLKEESPCKFIQIVCRIHSSIGLSSFSCCRVEHSAPGGHLPFCHVPHSIFKASNGKFPMAQIPLVVKFIPLYLMAKPKFKGLM